MFRLLIGLTLSIVTSAAVAQTGTIEGTVKLPARESAEPKSTPQYPGKPGTSVPYPDSPIAAIVYVKGKIEGKSFAPPARHPSLSQKDAWFTPEVMAVLVGTTVDFPNLDNQYHNIFSYSKPKRFDLGRYPTGESRSVTFDQPGMVKIYCEIHAHMHAFVLVTENPYFHVTDPQGRFRIENVPPGHYPIAVWRARGKEIEKEVDVVAGESLKLSFE
jgi:hypothetical protein